MEQQTFAEVSFERYRKATRRERFLDEMARVIPWGDLAGVIAPFYPKAEGAGRPPVGIARMLRIHFLQHWFNLSDPAVEEALYDSRAMRQFVGIDLGREPVPDETTICKFRHLLEAHHLGEQLFMLIRTYLAEQGLQITRGTIVDATIISAPSSTKNRAKERDPEMHQTKKGNQWYFGMKAHIGVDSRTKLIHSVAATAANVHDSQVLPELLHGQETRVWGDAAYSGQRDVIQHHAPKATCFIQTKAHRHRPLSEADRAKNRTKSKVRAKVEHAFLVIKRLFGWTKVRYRGLAKNTNWLFISCGLANLYVIRRRLLAGTSGAGGWPEASAEAVGHRKRDLDQQIPTKFPLVISSGPACRMQTGINQTFLNKSVCQGAPDNAKVFVDPSVGVEREGHKVEKDCLLEKLKNPSCGCETRLTQRLIKVQANLSGRLK